MAEKFRFFDSVDGEDERYYTADEFAEYFRQLITSGIFNGGTNLQVLGSGTDMSITIQPGYAWLEGYLYKIDAEPLKLTIDAADPALDRIDRVVIRLDKRLDKRYVKAFILKGEPADEPMAPGLTRDENIYEIALAQIRVIAGKSFIGESEVTDERFDGTVCGIVNSLIKVDIDHLIEQLEDEWQTWFDNVQGSTYVINDDFIPLKNTTNNLMREVANLKLYQEATQRIENGIVFGDNFIDEPMGMEFNELSSTSIRDLEKGGIYFPFEAYSPLSLVNFSPVILTNYAAITFEPESNSWYFSLGKSGNPNDGYTSKEAAFVSNEKIDFTLIDKLKIELDIQNQLGGCYVCFGDDDYNSLKSHGNYSIKYLTPSEDATRKTVEIDISKVTGEKFLSVHYYFGYYSEKQGRVYSMGLRPQKSNTTITYNLGEGEGAAAFVKINGEIGIDGYINDTLMDKSLEGDGFLFTIELEEKADMKLKLEMKDRTSPSLNDSITRIIGGISK